MNDSPLVSICIPVYNGGAFVSSSVRSALNQTYVPLEVFVGDNVSTDDTPSILKAIDDPRLRYVRFEEHVGMAENWSRCVAHARGNLVLVLSADDALLDGSIERLVQALLEHGDCGFAFGRAQVITEGQEERAFGSALHDSPVGVLDVENELVRHGMTININALLLRRPPERPGIFDPTAGLVCDLELLLWLGRREIRGVGIEDPVVVYRVHSNALSSNRETLWRSTLEAYERYLPGARDVPAMRKRIALTLLWLTVFLLDTGKRERARQYQERWSAALPLLFRAGLSLMIRFPGLRHLARRLRSGVAKGMSR